MVQRELVIFSVPSLCLPSVPSLWALLPEDPLEAFIPFSLVPFPESELVVFLVPKESLEFPRGTLTPEDTEGHGATARDGRIIRHGRALRMSCVVFRIISSTETLSALISAVFRASSNCVSKCFARCWSRLLSFSETPSWEREKKEHYVNPRWHSVITEKKPCYENFAWKLSISTRWRLLRVWFQIARPWLAPY